MKKIYLIQQSWANKDEWETIYAEENEEDAVRDINRAIGEEEGAWFKYRIQECILYSH